MQCSPLRFLYVVIPLYIAWFQSGCKYNIFYLPAKKKNFYICRPAWKLMFLGAGTKMVVPGGLSLPMAEKIHIAPVRIMPTLGIFSEFLSFTLWTVSCPVSALKPSCSNMKRYVSALTIAGSDPSGGAGLQADLKTFSALGVYGASAITAVTVQNTVGVNYVHAVPPQVVHDQIAAVMEDIRPDAVKIGMVNDGGTLAAVVRALEEYRPRYLVVDPVMVSTSGCALMQADALKIMRERLLPMADLVTPNLPEAFTLAYGHYDGCHGGDVRLCGFDIGEVDKVANDIVSLGVKALLIKGGHAEGAVKTDVLYERGKSGLRRESFSAVSVNTVNTHGTGCTLSAAIAAFLALGLDIESAVRCGKNYLTMALAAGSQISIGQGHGPVNHFFRDSRLRSALITRLPEDVLAKSRVQFITHATERYSCEESALIALEGGCKWIQLRMKDADTAELESTARRILPECRRRDALLIIDDKVEVAMKIGADGVHLGKSDMPVSEARKLAGNAFIIGGTANTFEDICSLAAQGADYIGCGPYRFTTTKKNLAPVLGINGYTRLLSMMRQHGIALPLVAIGGIGIADINPLMQAGVGGIALSGSILRAEDPAGEMRKVLDETISFFDIIH